MSKLICSQLWKKNPFTIVSSVQVHILIMEKKLLVEKLWNTKKDATECNNEDSENKELPFSKNNFLNATSMKTSTEAVTESLDKSFQAGIPFGSFLL